MDKVAIDLLIVEDSEDDALLMTMELASGGFEPRSERVFTAADMRAALARSSFDIIISDYQMPRFDGLAALAIRNETCPDVPFVLVSGAVTEDVAVEAVKAGAGDYVLKQNLTRLVPVVQRELREAKARLERQRAERELERTRESFELVAKTSNDVIYDWDIERDSLWHSAAIRTAFGYPDGEIPRDGLEWHLSRVHPDDRGRIEDGERDALGRGDVFVSAEYRFLKADGSWATIMDRGHVVYDEGKPRRWVGSMMDVTQIRRLEEQFRQAQKMEALGVLAGGVAHDFNNILTVIGGYSQLLLSALPQTDAARAHVKEIAHAAERATALTRQLLAFSRKQVYSPAVLDVNDEIRKVEIMLRRLVSEQIELSLSLAPGLPNVKADPSGLEQVVLNLVVNAHEAMPEGGRLEIATARAAGGAGIVLSVADTGYGMTEETMARIFEPFFTTKEPGKGTGLGLSTVYGIVKQAGGSVEVESRPGAGSTFRVTLPATGEVSGSPAPVSSEARATGTETVLLVEDEEPVRTFARLVLESEGYRVLEAPDGQEALDLSDRHPGPLHLLLTDTVMPRLGGPALFRQLRERRRGLRVLFMSGYPGRDVDEEISEAFLPKPFQAQQLLRRVRDVLDGPEPG